MPLRHAQFFRRGLLRWQAQIEDDGETALKEEAAVCMPLLGRIEALQEEVNCPQAVGPRQVTDSAASVYLARPHVTDSRGQTTAVSLASEEDGLPAP